MPGLWHPVASCPEPLRPPTIGPAVRWPPCPAAARRETVPVRCAGLPAPGFRRGLRHRGAGRAGSSHGTAGADRPLPRPGTRRPPRCRVRPAPHAAGQQRYAAASGAASRAAPHRAPGRGRHRRLGGAAQGSAPAAGGMAAEGWRRNHRYGTIICDLERRRVVALLPDREVATAETWLRQHPEIGIVSRDRGGGYGEAAARALPDAVQVADRWHLLENASAAFLDAVRRSMRAIRSALGAATLDPRPAHRGGAAAVRGLPAPRGDHAAHPGTQGGRALDQGDRAMHPA